MSAMSNEMKAMVQRILVRVAALSSVAGTVTLLLGVFALSAAAITVGMYLSLLAVGSIWGLIGLKRGNLFWWRRLRSPEEEIPVVWRIALPVSRSPSEFAPSESIPGVEVVSDAALAATGTMSSNVCSGDDRATSLPEALVPSVEAIVETEPNFCSLTTTVSGSPQPTDSSAIPTSGSSAADHVALAKPARSRRRRQKTREMENVKPHFQPGETVYHVKYGSGEVVEFHEAPGPSFWSFRFPPIVVVDFAEYGRQRIDAASADISRRPTTRERQLMPRELTIREGLLLSTDMRVIEREDFRGTKVF